MIVHVHTHLVNYDPSTVGYRDFLERYRPGYFGEFSRRFADPAAVFRSLGLPDIAQRAILGQTAARIFSLNPLTTGSDRATS